MVKVDSVRGNKPSLSDNSSYIRGNSVASKYSRSKRSLQAMLIRPNTLIVLRTTRLLGFAILYKDILANFVQNSFRLPDFNSQGCCKEFFGAIVD